MHARIRPLPLPDDSSRETEALTLSLVEMGTKFVGLVQGGNRAQDMARMFTAQEDPLQLAFMMASLMNLEAAQGAGAAGNADSLGRRCAWCTAGSRTKWTCWSCATRSPKKRARKCPRSSASTCCGSRSAPSSRNWARRTPIRPKSSRCASGWPRPILPEDIRKEAERELGRLEKLPSAQPEYNVIRTWLEYVIELPWNKTERGQTRPEAGPRDAGRRSLRHHQSEGADYRATGGVEAESGSQGSDSVPGGRARRGKDFAGAIHRAGVWDASSNG